MNLPTTRFYSPSLHDALPISIVRQLERELNRRLGFAEAEIISARELRDSERQELESEVGKLTGKKVRAHYSKDGSDRKSTRLNSSHITISYAVFCLKKKTIKK